MFGKIVSALRAAFGQPAKPAQREERQHFEELERQAPIRPQGEVGAPAGPSDAYLCREAILGRDQRVAGYQFMLHEGTRNRIRARGRRIHHVYAEVLVRNIAQAQISRLLGHRTTFLDIPDSFLGHPSLLELPAANTVFVITALDEDGVPTLDELRQAIAGLHAAGYRIGLRAQDLDDERRALLPEADFVALSAAAADPGQVKALAATIRASGGRTQLLARDLPSPDDFQLCHALGAALFQGPFVSSRQDWHGNRLGPNTARLAQIISRLRRDADTRELVALLKQDAALSLRLLRYINSAAVGLKQDVASIEQALLQLGREKLYRWLLLLLYGAEKGSPMAAAALENALVRARLMELLGEGRSDVPTDELYLVGLLSLVDVLLQVPLAEAIATLAPTPAIENALLRGEGPLADFLALAVACEDGTSSAMEAAAAKCGISPATATRRHLEAFTWALEINA